MTNSGAPAAASSWSIDDLLDRRPPAAAELLAARRGRRSRPRSSAPARRAAPRCARRERAGGRPASSGRGRGMRGPRPAARARHSVGASFMNRDRISFVQSDNPTAVCCAVAIPGMLTNLISASSECARSIEERPPCRTLAFQPEAAALLRRGLLARRRSLGATSPRRAAEHPEGRADPRRAARSPTASSSARRSALSRAARRGAASSPATSSSCSAATRSRPPSRCSAACTAASCSRRCRRCSAPPSSPR